MIYFMCVSILPACMYVYHMYAWYPGGQKRGLYPLELELWVTVSYQVGTRNGIQVLCKDNKYF